MTDIFSSTQFLSCGSIFSLDENQIVIGIGKRIWIESPVQYPAWFAPDFFFDRKAPYFFHDQCFIIKKENFSLNHQTALPMPEFSPIRWGNFEQSFNEIGQDLIKTVPYVKKSASFKVTEPFLQNSLKCALTYWKKNPKSTLYGYWDTLGGVLGVTPEILLKITPEKPIETMACAGTASIEKSSQLQNNPKLLKEHEIVIRGIQKALEPFGQVEILRTEIKAFAKLAHLLTPIKLYPKKNIDKELLVKALHPTPALGAFPKGKGSLWLRAFDKSTPRNTFGAPFGVILSPDQAHICVAIRNMTWDLEEVHLFAGCGIVSESVFETEKDEILNKFSAIEEILGLC